MKCDPRVWQAFSANATASSGTLSAIREYVDHLAFADGVLQPFPVVGVVQLAMQLGKQTPLLDIGEQKARKLLGKHIVGTHRIPGLGRHLVLGIARLGYVTEVHFGEKADLVVV